MKVIFGVVLLSLIGLSRAQTHSEERSRVNRIKRNAYFGVQQSLPKLKFIISGHCNESNIEPNEFEKSFNNMRTCLSNIYYRHIYIIPKNEFLSKITTCIQDSINITENCLPDDKKYFPNLLLNLMKSTANFMYDDLNLQRGDVVTCLDSINDFAIRRARMNCLINAMIRTNDVNEIPSSKKKFCETFLPGSYCFPKMLKKACDAPGVNKYIRDYENSLRVPCGEPEIPEPLQTGSAFGLGGYGLGR